MKLVYQRMLSQIIMVAIILLGILFLPVKSLYSINSLMIVTTLTHRLYWEIRFSEKPTFKGKNGYLVHLVKTIFWTSTFVIIFSISGELGLIGYILLIVSISALRIYQGRKLFNSFTIWAADRAWGKTKKNFSFEKSMEEIYNEERSGKEKLGVDEPERFKGKSNSDFEESNSHVSESKHSRAGEAYLSKVYYEDQRVRPLRRRNKKRKALQELSEDLGSRKELNKKIMDGDD